ncbi:thioredoxin family protein [uncultured Tenacibaculum sp.]|uniref:thioredoxin family protein n=1 Tax=uncultured Tenacibaculum sp. TaxID=174713 RepID=UPI002638DB0B|nr:thioredoxin family protein [uncultured Tenacibaculum sp.]
MKKLFLTITSLLLFTFCYSQTLGSVVKDEKGNPMLLGKVSRTILEQKDFSWFSKNYEAYLTNDKLTKLLKKKLKDYKIKIFFGSWCGDSKRNVPAFYKVLDEAKFPKEAIELIAVDRKKEAYKQSPNGEEKGLNIHRVPTFIIYKNGKEVNRIVEDAKETLERDLYKIVANEKYTSKYNAANLLDKLFNNQKQDLQTIEKQLIRFLPQIDEGVKELNTYGFVKLRAKQYEKAKFAFELNAKMYPNHYVPHNSLGILYKEQKHYKKALASLYISLSINPDNKDAKTLIKEIETINLK